MAYKSSPLLMMFQGVVSTRFGYRSSSIDGRLNLSILIPSLMLSISAAVISRQFSLSFMSAIFPFLGKKGMGLVVTSVREAGLMLGKPNKVEPNAAAGAPASTGFNPVWVETVSMEPDVVLWIDVVAAALLNITNLP